MFVFLPGKDHRNRRRSNIIVKITESMIPYGLDISGKIVQEC